MKTFVLIAAAAVLSGCATVSRVDGARCHAETMGAISALESVQVMNSGWKLLSCIPLASGDPRNPGKVTCRLFRDTVKLQSQLDMLEAEARRVGAKKVENVMTSYSEERVFLFLLLREKILTSATLVK